jgi:hypothetical protein
MMAEAFRRCYYNPTGKQESFHAQIIFEKPTDSALFVSVVVRCIGDNVPGQLGYRPK